MPDTGYECRLGDSEMNELVRYRRNRDVVRPHHKAEPLAAVSGDAKPADPKAAETKAAETKAAETKPADAAAPDDASKSEPLPKADAAPADAKPAAGEEAKPATEPEGGSTKTSSFVDRQLQKALDYLNQEMTP